jgi:capsular polysaccharide biosynthesis protein
LKVVKAIGSIRVVRRLPLNLIETHKVFFRRLLSVRIPQIDILERRGLSLTAQGVVFKGIMPLKALLLHNDTGPVIAYSFRDVLKILIYFPRVVLRNDVQFMIIDNVYSHTYYHWLTESLPRLFLLKDKISNGVLLLPSNHNEKFHVESLAIFNIVKVEKLQRDVRYVVPRLITSTQIGTIANYHPQVMSDMVSFLLERIDLKLNLGEKIYVSRSRADKRNAVNANAVEDYLIRRGFVIVHFEDFSFSQQVSIMHNCKVLVGIHGAGLANMIFMRNGGKILELRKFDNGENYFYFSLSSIAGLDYYYQFCEAKAENVSVQDADIIIDLVSLDKNINCMLQ